MSLFQALRIFRMNYLNSVAILVTYSVDSVSICPNARCQNHIVSSSVMAAAVISQFYVFFPCPQDEGAIDISINNEYLYVKNACGNRNDAHLLKFVSYVLYRTEIPRAYLGNPGCMRIS